MIEQPFALGQLSKDNHYFNGDVYLEELTKEPIRVTNVTFDTAVRNHWHIHHKGGQILLVTAGFGWYQAWGEPAQFLKTGDVVNIPAELKHWHGAARDSQFVHIAISVPAKDASTEWLEVVSDADFDKLKKD
ncbi:MULTISPECIES: cupin domain-containing protein [unclassified Enterococcus]|uniref:cupin domain-containing protein n=1 Tax=unclassified Enterococcus TaxID=2608891 RepID=UPI001BCAA0FE|nr:MULTISPECIES: cupin domain-containing protein [unclassified Enterococcus]MBS7576370.1 cupin domain-containing protein [Enterococcus sp. MMGLQ5-2]MBS7583602.1 cupin domain-containing protein [Enterococcus sp. MMGLQ5-1]